MANMLILFYMFCGGNMKDNLVGIFNLFDADGNKVITLNELYEIMAVFIELGEGKDHKVSSRLKKNLLKNRNVTGRSIWPRLWPRCFTRRTSTRMK